MAVRRGALHAVEAGEGPARRTAKPIPKTVSQAASGGSTREVLVAMRDRIAKAVENENTPARDLAALTKRLMETVRDIEAIDARANEETGAGAEVTDGSFDPATL